MLCFAFISGNNCHISRVKINQELQVFQMSMLLGIIINLAIRAIIYTISEMRTKEFKQIEQLISLFKCSNCSID